jgi:ABC-2 type transport system ATP-binding protein
VTTAIEVDGLGKRFRLYYDKNQTIKTAVLRGGRARYQELWAVRNVSLEVPQGTTFGLIGSNGSGKSTLLRCLARILRPDEGSYLVRGRVAALLELGSGFHHELTGRQNVYLNGTILGLKEREIDQRMNGIIEFSGLEAAIDQPVKNYSSGMYARLGFAVATSVDPEVLLVDEVLAVGDVAFQRRCMERIQELRRDGRTVVIVSHDSNAVRTLCDAIVWLRDGAMQQAGSTADVLDAYLRASADDPLPSTVEDDQWGTGEATLLDVALVNAAGEDTTEVVAGRPVSLRLRWKRAASVPEVVAAVFLSAADGSQLWEATTLDAGLSLSGATGTLVVEIPALPLQPGPYWFDAALQDPTGGHVYDHRRHAVRFSVRGVRGREGRGHLSLAPVWRVELPRSDSPVVDSR